MKRTLAILFLASSGLATLAAHAADAEDIVKYRRNLMDANGGLMGASNAILQDKVNDKARLAGYAQALANLNREIAAQFPAGSGSPDSDALPEVWSKRAEFERRAREAETRAAAFAKTPSRPAFTALADACKSCHKDFRK